jgi:hypothetical protein
MVQVLEIALKLPKEQRLRLAEQLCESVEDESQSFPTRRSRDQQRKSCVRTRPC